MSVALMVIGLALLAVGEVILLVTAFKEGILWGLGMIFFPPAALLFFILFWQECKKPFFMQLGGLALVVVGILTGPSSAPVSP